MIGEGKEGREWDEGKGREREIERSYKSGHGKGMRRRARENK